MRRHERWRIRDHNRRSDWVLRRLDEMSLDHDPIVIEIGVWKAGFGSSVLEKSDKVRWIGIDPYLPYSGDALILEEGLPLGGWEGAYKDVAQKVSRYEGRFQLIRKGSEEALSFVPDGVDLVYLDGKHTYPMVTNEINGYLSKLHEEGIMSGHDYNHPEVRNAVDDYAVKTSRYLILDPLISTWWFQRRK